MSAESEGSGARKREIYARLNNFEQLANHGVPVIARFRGYLSKAAAKSGAACVWEMLVQFEADAPSAPWKMAYEALRARPEFDATVEV